MGTGHLRKVRTCYGTRSALRTAL